MERSTAGQNMAYAGRRGHKDRQLGPVPFTVAGELPAYATTKHEPNSMPRLTVEEANDEVAAMIAEQDNTTKKGKR